MSTPSTTIHAPQLFYQDCSDLLALSQNTQNTLGLQEYLKIQGVDIYLRDSSLETFKKRVGELLLKALPKVQLQYLTPHQITIFLGYIREVRRLRTFREIINKETDPTRMVRSVTDSLGMVQSALSCFGYSVTLPDMRTGSLAANIDNALGILGAALLYSADPLVGIDPISQKLRMDFLPSSLPVGAEIVIDPEPLGVGGSAIVYKGTVLLKGKALEDFAIKIPRGSSYSSKEALNAFARDQKFLEELQTVKGICRQFGTGLTKDGSFFAILELLSSERISHRMQKISKDEAYLVIWRVAQTLADLHSRGKVHLDLKPENVGIRLNGDIVLLDFGNAADVSQNESRPICGHAYYLPPEILKRWHNLNLNELTPEEKKSWDVWLFGMLAYQLLSKERHPYGIIHKDSNDSLYDTAMELYGGSPSYEDLTKHGVSIPPEMKAWIRKCLSLDPHERYPHMEAVAQACNKFLPYAKYRELYHDAADSFDETFKVLRAWDEELFMNGDYDLQEEIFDLANESFQKLNETKIKTILMADFFYRRARTLMRMGNKKSAQENLNIAATFLKEEGLPPRESLELKASILAERAFFILPPDEAINETSEFRKLNEFSKDLSPLYRARLLMAQMSALRKLRCFEQALEIGYEVVSAFISAKEYRKANESLAGIGNCLIGMEKYEEAIALLRKSCEIAKDKFQNKGPNVDTLYINLGEAFLRADRPQEAIEVLEGARLNFPDSQNMIPLLEYLSEAYALNEQVDHARSILSEIEKRERLRGRLPR
ncbi:MAG: tetratricopeptide repeat protein [Deltaproteobacteria bacterium]|nr:MAG: tetratricopeptide repeat protein [Deltaproteobacteria bacterium]